MYCSARWSTSMGRIRVPDKERADGEIIQRSLQKRPHRVLWCVHNGLFVHVETGIDQAGNTTDLLVFLEDVVIAGIHLAADQLRSRGAVDVDRCRTVVPHELGAIESDGHEFRAMLGAADVVIALLPGLVERHRRKRHELSATQTFV